jgi:2-haloacid dehalogenase
MNTPHCRLISFDCYGTLIDWETGLLTAMRSALPNLELSDDDILRDFSEMEPRIQGMAYKPYREILREVLFSFAKRCGKTPMSPDALADSIAGWNPFPDTVQALGRLKSKYQLAILSNIDNDLFVATARRLIVPFDHVITAEDVGSYKPNQRNFEMLLERTGMAAGEIIHAGESLFHDIAPARSLGITTAWVNRPNGRTARASKVVETNPAFTVCDLNGLADKMC